MPPFIGKNSLVKVDGVVHQVTEVGVGVSGDGGYDIHSYRTACLEPREDAVHVPFKEEVRETYDKSITCLGCLAR